jgi:hypothetical protein
MLDLIEVAAEADKLAAEVRSARCCDALSPCYRCSMLRRNVIARRQVVEFPKPHLRLVPAPRLAPVLAVEPLEPLAS